MIETQTATLAPKPKKFPPGTCQPVGHDIEFLAVAVPDDWTFGDVMKPTAWVFEAHKFAANPLGNARPKIGSIILASSSKFFAMLRVQAVTVDAQNNPAGLTLLCIGPSFNSIGGKAAPINAHNGMPWNG